MPSVFISHTHSDKEIADALHDVIHELFGDTVRVRYSTSKEIEGGIPTGEDWYDWIVETVRDSAIAFVLLTPSSIQKPWILWEAGLVTGAAAANEEERQRKVRPLVFQLSASDIPSPFQKIQTTAGDRRDDIKAFLIDLIDQFRQQKILDGKKLFEAGTRLDPAVESYLARVSAALLRAPIVVTEAAVQEWLDRLDAFEERPSEVNQIDRWIKVAFGRELEEEDRPLDLRIHRRLGAIYSKAGTIPSKRRAAREFELARQLSPRDIYVLRQLGNAYIEIEEFDRAWDVIKQIEEFDSDAFVRSPETAALRGKWHRRNNDPKSAFEVFESAFRHNTNSHYLANLAAEASLEAKDLEHATEFYEKSLAIIDSLREPNIWTHASATNALIALGRIDEARDRVAKVAEGQPTTDQEKSILDGIKVVKEGFGRQDEKLAPILASLGGHGPK